MLELAIAVAPAPSLSWSMTRRWARSNRRRRKDEAMAMTLEMPLSFTMGATREAEIGGVTRSVHWRDMETLVIDGEAYLIFHINILDDVRRFAFRNPSTPRLTIKHEGDGFLICNDPRVTVRD
jgi:hypothetical protein